MRFLRPLVVVLSTSLGIASVATPIVAQAVVSNVQAQDTAIQSGSVPITTDAVASATSISGLKQWQFSLGNSGTTQVSGATIAVHSTGPALNNLAQFSFLASVSGPPSGQPTPPTPVTCATATAADESCGPASVAPGGGQLMVSTGSAPPGQPARGVPTTFTPGFDSARNGTIASQWSVPVTLTAASFAQGGEVMVNLWGHFLSTGAQVTTANGSTVPVCSGPPPSGSACAQPPQFQPGGTTDCGGAWSFHVQGAQPSIQYIFSAQQGSCASDKPIVDISAGTFSPPSTPTTADSVPIQDPNLGTITYTVSPAATGSPPNSFNTATNNQVQLEYQGVAPACPPACGGPRGNLQAQDTAIQSASVATTTDAVTTTMSLSGLRQWQFSLGNSGTSPANGATIAVRTASTGPALNNSAQFGFSASLNAPPSGTPTPPTPVNCTAPTATDESCGPASVALGGGQLMVFTGSAPPGQPVPGVPTTFTPGFESARNGTVGSQWMVPVTLSQAAFPQNGDIMVSLRGNFQQTAGAQITTGNVAVPACTPGVFNPTACSESQFQPGGQGSCNGAGAWFLAVHNSAPATTYTFAARQDPCATGKPVVDITAGSFSPPTAPTTADSVPIQDPNLGTITFTVSAAAAGSPPNSFNTATNNQVQLEYQGIAPACPPACGGPGSNLAAQEQNIQVGSVPATSDSVSGTMLLAGVRTWNLFLPNLGQSPVNGAKISVDSTSTGIDLTDASHFAWSASVFNPPPGQSANVACTTSTTTATCGPSSVAIGSGGNLGAFAGPGIPSTFTPGFDSQRQGAIGGQWSVSISLTDASRYGQGAEVSVGLGGNFLDSSAQVTANGTAVAQCSPSTSGSATCARSQFIPGGPGSCGGLWSFDLMGARLSTTASPNQYVFTAQQGSCANAKPIVDVATNRHAQNCCTPGDSAALTDPDLGTITYSVNPSTPPNSFGTGTDRIVNVHYEGGPPCPPNCGATPAPSSGPVLPFTGGRGQHHALPPARILDTRDGTGAVSMSSLAIRNALDRMSAANLGPGGTMDVQITGRGGVPATGVAAVIMNVTVTNTTGSGYLVVYPNGVARPLASNLNWIAGQTVPNLLEVPVSAEGKVTVFNSAGSTDVIFDIAGYVSTSAQSSGLSGLYNPIVPGRLLDTRTGLGGASTVGAGGTISLQVTGRGGVPAIGVSAVVLNVTATGPTASSYVTVWPDGASRPVASNLNFVAGQTVPNRVMVPVGAGGKVDLYLSLIHI